MNTRLLLVVGLIVTLGLAGCTTMDDDMQAESSMEDESMMEEESMGDDSM